MLLAAFIYGATLAPPRLSHIRYFISVFFQSYFPAMIMVMLGGLTMWIDPKSVPARVSMGKLFNILPKSFNILPIMVKTVQTKKKFGIQSKMRSFIA